MLLRYAADVRQAADNLRAQATRTLLTALGIVFGAVHALTPGHGKTILATYVVGARLAALRALAVAGVLALTHVGTAVLLALAAAPIVTITLGGAGRTPILENISRGLLAAIGLWFLVRAFRGRIHEHREGITVAVIAGLVPCPLTLKYGESHWNDRLMNAPWGIVTVWKTESPDPESKSWM